MTVQCVKGHHCMDATLCEDGCHRAKPMREELMVEALTKLSSDWLYAWAGQTRSETIINVQRIAAAALNGGRP